MRLSYSVLIQRTEPYEINQIEVRDLNLILKDEQLTGIDASGLNQFIADKIRACLQERNASGSYVDDPKGSEQYANIKLAKHDELRTVFLDFELKRGFFAGFLPQLSKIFYVIAEVFSTIISVSALEITTADETHSTTGRVLSMIGSASFCISGFIMFFYSRSSYTMSKLGMKIDNLLQRKSSKEVVFNPKQNKVHRTCAGSTKIILGRVGLGSLLVAQIVVSNISGYQGLNALGKRAKEIGSVIPEELFDLSKWAVIILGSISTFSFVGSFFDQFSEDLERWVDQGRQEISEIKINNNESNLQLHENKEESESGSDNDSESHPLLALARS